METVSLTVHLNDLATTLKDLRDQGYEHSLVKTGEDECQIVAVRYFAVNTLEKLAGS